MADDVGNSLCVVNDPRRTLRLAIDDLACTHGNRYAVGPNLLTELTALEQQAQEAKSAARAETPWRLERLWSLSRELYALKRRALLSNPAIENLQILCVKRGWNDRITPGSLTPLGISSNHECHSSISPVGYGA